MQPSPGLSLPLPLQTALEAGRCVLFVGAGVGRHARDAAGETAPLAEDLARQLADQFGIDAGERPDLSRIAQVVHLRHGRPELDAFLADCLSRFHPDAILSWITTIRWAAIFTTNYDDFIERTYSASPNPVQIPVTVSVSADMKALDPRFEVPVYHLHGSLLQGDDRTIIITARDYATFRVRRAMLFELLKQHSATATFLYLGYSNRDPNWQTLLAELQQDFSPSQLPVSYRVAPSTDPIEREILEAQSLYTVDASIEEFVALASTLLNPSVQAPGLDALGASVPSDLAKAFAESPAATARLLRSWTYVNEAPFSEVPNTTDFLHGDPPNWGLIGQRLHIERDVEGEVLDALLDYATTERAQKRVLALLAPAGFGTTTVLMSLAARLVHEKAGPVFFHRPGTPLAEADVVFATSLFEARPFFLVDNAADFAAEIAGALSQHRDLGRAVLFLAGERLNEWRQRPVADVVSEFGLLALSDAEVERLIDFLARQGALNKLGELERPLQRAAIKEKSEKQLLVAMREATQGMGFDAIIEDEFRNLASDLARSAYGSVACLYRLRAYTRDNVLSASVDMPLLDFYPALGQMLAGVVRFECIDETTGEYAARARHHVIAEIVWERCVDQSERADTVLAVLRALILNYFIDRKAFDAMVRSDRTIDSLATLESKMNFFESARRKDPNSPYVLQHYARMLLRERKADLALAQIDRALELAPRLRVLHHTRGVVLRDMALTLESVELARRRLVQSESAFRQALRIDERDEYSYQALGELFLGWAKRQGDTEERAAYITKTQEVLEEGLRKVRSREGLWIVFSDLERWLGNTPEAEAALASAVKANPEGRIGRFLLGRFLRRRGETARAAEILAGVLETYPEDHGSSLEYARASMELGEPRSRTIAILELSRPHGFRDAAYIATLGGLLFLEMRFSEAADVFDEATKRQFSFREKTRIPFRPRSPDGSLILRGVVRVVKPGYAFVEVPGYPSFLCPGSRFGGLIMTPGLEVSFEVGFSARGAVALNPRAVVGEGAS